MLNFKRIKCSDFNFFYLNNYDRLNFKSEYYINDGESYIIYNDFYNGVINFTIKDSDIYLLIFSLDNKLNYNYLLEILLQHYNNLNYVYVLVDKKIDLIESDKFKLIQYNCIKNKNTIHQYIFEKI